MENEFFTLNRRVNIFTQDWSTNPTCVFHRHGNIFILIDWNVHSREWQYFHCRFERKIPSLFCPLVLIEILLEKNLEREREHLLSQLCFQYIELCELTAILWKQLNQRRREDDVTLSRFYDTLQWISVTLPQRTQEAHGQSLLNVAAVVVVVLTSQFASRRLRNSAWSWISYHRSKAISRVMRALLLHSRN